MKTTASKINTFLLFKLPSAYFCGVRVKSLSEEQCTVSVTHRWINQNPFKSMFWAVQGMAAELSTGALVMSHIRASEAKISMLVLNNKATFTKKAKGRIRFECYDGLKMAEAIKQTLATGQGQTCWMQAKGVDQAGDVVSHFSFEWTVKRKA